MTKRLFTYLLLGILTIAPLFSVRTFALSGGEFQAGRIIDDSKFFSAPNMGINDIQNFLNAKVPVCDTWGTQPYAGTTRAAYAASRGVSTPFTCLKDSRDTVQAKSAELGLCNGLPAGSGTAAEIIYWVSVSCGINPQVLIVLLQKEQSLITDDWPWPIQYRSATGYGCPDTAACDSAYYGFFNQVYNAARQFKRYARDSSLFSYRAGFNNYIQYNPNAGCGGSTVYIQNQATASLYNYTPYQPNPSALANLYGTGDGCGAYGNRNFWRMFNDWFGSTFGPVDYSCKNSTNVSSVGSGGKVIANWYAPGEPDRLSLSILNNTGSKCIEAHTWNPGYQSWLTNVATNLPAIDPADGEIISGNIVGARSDQLIFVKYRNTGSGRIEIHTWNPGYQTWMSNIATNYPAIDPSEGRVIAANVIGDYRDELIFVKYRNTGSGRIEIHTWNPGYQTWMSNIATSMPSTEADNGKVIGADVYTEGRDRLSFVKYVNTGSGRIEIHTWNPGYQHWLTNVATNHPMLDPANGEVLSADTNADGRDEMIFAIYRTTGSGRIEIHTWNPGYQTWMSNIATNLPALGN